MIDHHATVAPAVTFPPGRYGRRRSPRRRRPWLVALVGCLVALAAAGLTVRLYSQYGNPDHTGTILVETERTADHVTFRYEARNRPGTGPATCHVKAVDSTGGVVGEADLAVPGVDRVTAVFTLPVTAPATNVEIVRCTGAPGNR